MNEGHQLWTGPGASPVFTGGTCVVVGNGPSLLGSKLGPVIDAFDTVVRFNAYRTEGFERDVGSKTTLVSNFGRGVRPLDTKLPDRVLYPLGSKGGPAWNPRLLWRISDEFLGRYEEDWARRHNPEGTRPSSGFLICSWLLEVTGGPLHLAGFDHFGKGRSSAHHYWDSGPKSIPKPHRGPCEARAFAQWAEEGRVFYLT